MLCCNFNEQVKSHSTSFTSWVNKRHHHYYVVQIRIKHRSNDYRKNGEN